MTSLFKSKSSQPSVNISNTNPRKRLLVPSSPESNCSETFSNKVNDDDGEDEENSHWEDDFVEQIDESDITDNNDEEFSGNDDYLLSEAVKAAEAAEVNWLTEGLIKDDDVINMDL
uniref:SJCHGC03423 protein n=1 Tax=Schistosoma japonicum TaxID=6182 RepID=Q5DB63_SCHJA|nr:SJCHGC03423 protein [Schistosoma japonicum]